jgi:hypothetical protein
MTIVVFGDIHGATVNLMRLTPVLRMADLCVFVGDDAGSLSVLPEDVRGKLVGVRGNCDFFCKYPDELFFDDIFVTHGHQYGVKGTLGLLVEACKARGARVCFFGHNHRQSYDLIDGVALVNPGTLGTSRTGKAGQYAIVIKRGEKFLVEFKGV